MQSIRPIRSLTMPESHIFPVKRKMNEITWALDNSSTYSHTWSGICTSLERSTLRMWAAWHAKEEMQVQAGPSCSSGVTFLIQLCRCISRGSCIERVYEHELRGARWLGLTLMKGPIHGDNNDNENRIPMKLYILAPGSLTVEDQPYTMIPTKGFWRCQQSKSESWWSKEMCCRRKTMGNNILVYIWMAGEGIYVITNADQMLVGDDELIDWWGASTKRLTVDA